MREARAMLAHYAEILDGPDPDPGFNSLWGISRVDDDLGADPVRILAGAANAAPARPSSEPDLGADFERAPDLVVKLAVHCLALGGIGTDRRVLVERIVDARVQLEPVGDLHRGV